jgi:hypothetical protein
MKISFTLLISIICAVGAYAQATQISGNVGFNRPVNILPENARFQLVPVSQISINLIKLDRFTGRTQSYDYSRRRWLPLQVRGGLPVSSNNTSPKYEIYAEGSDANFLLNTETGQTWVLSTYSMGWEPIPD